MIYSSSIIKKGKLRRSEYNNVIFDNIKIIDNDGLNSVFYGCTSITSVSFPELTSIGSNGLYKAFDRCINITEIHFRADAQSTVEAATGYSSKFGATNATIYFDL